jgi:two-component system nitrogen regulation response regulator GlnG
MMQKLLIIDDEPNICRSLQESLASNELVVFTAGSARAGIEQARKLAPDAVLLDVRLPDMSGLDAYDRIREIDPRIPVILMTAFAKTDTAIEAMRRGAFEYLVKPVDFRRLQTVLGKALETSRLGHVPARLAEDDEEDVGTDADRIIGFSPAMQEVYKMIGRVAPQDATVLILGESGTGKELVARAVYHYSRRNQRPFLAINCAALSETLLESELFGHEKGAFTGADQRRIGKFEQVSGGTIFLDEIGDMSPATQAKALRLLQQQQFERVGGNATIQTDVRIIAATNCDLPKLVEEGKFRRDLFYRLNGFTISLPPLRDRRDDIPVLAEHFLKRFNRELHKTVRSITLEALECLRDHDWPGNVRELESAIRYALVRAGGDVLTADNLPEPCRTVPATEAEPADRNELVASEGMLLGAAGNIALDLAALTQRLLKDESTNVYREVGSHVDQIVLETVLKHVNGNQLLAAEYLGISRMTLRQKLRALGLPTDRYRG